MVMPCWKMGNSNRWWGYRHFQRMVASALTVYCVMFVLVALRFERKTSVRQENSPLSFGLQEEVDTEKIIPTTASTPKSFEERLEFALPNRTYLSVKDVEKAEAIVFSFHIPRPIVLQWPHDELPLDYRYPTSISQQCPNCTVRTWNASSVYTVDAVLQGHKYRKTAGVATICGCGEAQTGTGKNCFENIKSCTLQNSFKRIDPLWSSYSRLQYPPEHLGVNSVTKLVERILTPWPHNANATERTSLVAMHSNCGGTSGRGKLLQILLNLDMQMQQQRRHGFRALDSYGRCWHNREMGEFEPHTQAEWHWHDSEGNRDTTKTDVASRYRVTAALENTIDMDYFTEKRFQALVSGSSPLIYRRPEPYSEQYLPHPNAAIFADDFDTPRQLHAYLLAIAGNDTMYHENHQAWKQNDGISREFVKILFHGLNFLPCRACEILASAPASTTSDASVN